MVCHRCSFMVCYYLFGIFLSLVSKPITFRFLSIQRYFLYLAKVTQNTMTELLLISRIIAVNYCVVFRWN